MKKFYIIHDHGFDGSTIREADTADEAYKIIDKQSNPDQSFTVIYGERVRLEPGEVTFKVIS